MQWLSDAQIAAQWPSLGALRSRAPQGGGLLLTSDAGRFHLKARPRARIHAEVWVLHQLQQRGLPVTEPVVTAQGQPQVITPEAAYFLYRELPGQPRPRLLDQPGDAERLGAACAFIGRELAHLDLTTALAHGLPVRDNPRDPGGLPQQLIHRDFHAGNVLFTGDQITGWIDFDHLELGPRLVDLVYLAGSVLAELTAADSASPDRPEIFLDRWQRLLTGHRTITDLSEVEADACADLLIAVEEDFHDWFVSIDDPANATLTRTMISCVEGIKDEMVAPAAR